MTPAIIFLSVLTIMVGLFWLKNKKPNLRADFVFQAKTQATSFHYPLGWTLKIDDTDIGYVFGPNGSQTRMWFTLNNGFFGACETTKGSIEIINSTPVKLPGLDQQLRYIEAVLPAHNNPNKYVVYFGLAPDELPFDQLQTFQGCLGDVKTPIFPSGATSGKTIIEFHSLMYANEFDAFTFASKADALSYFQTKEYNQAKQIIMSVKFDT